MFYAELVAPFFIFGPRPIRLVGFASMVLLQLLIAGDGKLWVFQLARDRALPDPAGRPGLGMAGRIVDRSAETSPRPPPKTIQGKRAGWRTWSMPRRVGGGRGGDDHHRGDDCARCSRGSGRAWSQPRSPSSASASSPCAAPIRTDFRGDDHRAPGDHRRGKRRRHELETVPVSLEARRAQPCPRFTTPHMPRLDWQLWFAALAGDCRSHHGSSGSSRSCWRVRPRCSLCCAKTRFPTGRRAFVRARWNSTSSRVGAHGFGGLDRIEGLFCPPIELRSFDRAD